MKRRSYGRKKIGRKKSKSFKKKSSKRLMRYGSSRGGIRL